MAGTVISRGLSARARDLCGGALMAVIGTAVAAQSLAYQVGTLGHMGPGFVPLVVGSLLALVGMGIALKAPPRVRPSTRQAANQAGRDEARPAWRGWGCIILGMLAFVLLGRHGGLLPACFALVFISALGDRSSTLRSALGLALVICAVCVVVFWWALQIQLPLFGWGTSS